MILDKVVLDYYFCRELPKGYTSLIHRNDFEFGVYNWTYSKSYVCIDFGLNHLRDNPFGVYRIHPLQKLTITLEQGYFQDEYQLTFEEYNGNVYYEDFRKEYKYYDLKLYPENRFFVKEIKPRIPLQNKWSFFKKKRK